MIVSTVVIVLFALKDNKFSDSNALSMSFISLMRVKMQFHIMQQEPKAHADRERDESVWSFC